MNLQTRLAQRLVPVLVIFLGRTLSLVSTCLEDRLALPRLGGNVPPVSWLKTQRGGLYFFRCIRRCRLTFGAAYLLLARCSQSLNSKPMICFSIQIASAGE